MATFTIFDEFIHYQLQGITKLDADTFKVALSNTAPSKANNQVFADITEISAGNGYTAGGNTLASVSLTESGSGTGIWVWTFASNVFTASGGSIGPFQYPIVYDNTPSSPSKPLVGYLDYGTAITVTSGNTFTVSVGVSGVIRASAS